MTTIAIAVGRLTAIEGLEGLTELRELYLSHNVIENAHGLESQVSSESTTTVVVSQGGKGTVGGR